MTIILNQISHYRPNFIMILILITIMINYLSLLNFDFIINLRLQILWNVLIMKFIPNYQQFITYDECSS